MSKDIPSDFQVEGIWRLPGQSDASFTGTLQYQPFEHSKLTIIGSFLDQDFGKRTVGGNEFPIILGELIDGEEINLVNSIQEGGFSTGIQRTKFYSELIIRGAHFNSIDEIRFLRVRIQFSNQNKWLRINSFIISSTPDVDSKRCERIVAEYRPRQLTKIGEIGEFSLYVMDREPNLTGLHFRSLFGGNYVDKFSLSEDKYLVLIPESPLPWGEYKKAILTLQNFLVFATGQITLPTNILATATRTVTEYVIDSDPLNPEPPEDKESVTRTPYFTIYPTGKRAETQEVPKDIETRIFYRIADLPEAVSGFDSMKILFYFDDIESISSMVLQGWERSSEELELVINLYLGLFYLPWRYVKDRFLNVSQALESFHRIVHGGEFIEREKYLSGLYQDLQKLIGEKSEEYRLTESYRSSLKSSLQYSYQYSLRKRLKELIEINQASLPEGFMPEEHRKSFIECVVNTRNFLTHLDPNSNREGVATGKNLVLLTRNLEALLRICLLRQIGVDEKTTQSICERFLLHTS